MIVKAEAERKTWLGYNRSAGSQIEREREREREGEREGVRERAANKAMTEHLAMTGKPGSMVGLSVRVAWQGCRSPSFGHEKRANRAQTPPRTSSRQITPHIVSAVSLRGMSALGYELFRKHERSNARASTVAGP